MTKSLAEKVLVILGAALLFVTALGDITSMGGYRNTNARSWERFDESLAAKTHSMADLIQEAKSRVQDYESFNDEQKMFALYEVVTDRFTHSAGARHTLFTNWLLASLGKFHPAFGIIMNPETLVEKGQSLVCSQSSYLLMHLALREGIVARHVGLNGHVVMESWYDNDWHLFDPDAEVVPRNQEGGVASVESLAQDAELLTATYSGQKANIVPIISTRQDNSFVSYPRGAYFEWKTQLLFQIEKAMNIVKYLIPFGMILLGVYLRFSLLKTPSGSQ